MAAVDELRNRMANRQSAEFDRETFGDRSGYSQQHRALHVTAIGEAAESVSGSRERDLDSAFAHIPVLDAPGAGNREPRFGRRPSSNRRTLLATKCSCPCWSRGHHPNQASRALHLSAAAEKAASAGHAPLSSLATYQTVWLIFHGAPR
ncbi:MAG: hypothetical protein F4Z55_05265 [Boseongicola sp. SB0667_bin_21]|nr:hypothetical protein [Boseongicola sp. SB0667_bin_21]